MSFKKVVNVLGKEIERTVYDDDNILLMRISTEFEDTLPNFFALKDRNNGAVEISDIRDDIKKMKVEDINDKPKSGFIFTKYPMNINNICLVWAQVFGVAESAIPLRKFNTQKFPSEAIITQKIQDFERYIASERKANEKVLKEFDKNYKQIDDIKVLDTIQMSPPVIEELTSELMFGVVTGYRLIDVFNDTVVSKKVPFVYYCNRVDFSTVDDEVPNIDLQECFKVHKKTPITEKWVNIGPKEVKSIFKVEIDVNKNATSFIYFKLLNVPENTHTVTKFGDTEVFYSDVLILLDYSSSILKIYFTFPVSEKKDLKSAKIDILQAMKFPENKEFYRKLKEQRSSIKAKFKVEFQDTPFLRAIFCDMVTNDNLVSNSYFFNERAENAMSKKMLYCYFKPMNGISEGRDPFLGGRPLLFSMVPFDEKEQFEFSSKQIEIRIYKTSSIRQLSSFVESFKRILSYYSEEQNKITKIYRSVIKDFDKVAEKKKTRKVKEKKTGQRLDRLRKVDPVLFGAGYAGTCQKHAQPYHMTREEYEDKKDEFDSKGKVMEYPLKSGHFYACEPRDKSDGKSAQKYIWATLKMNKGADKRERPCLPCCAEADQTTKNTSGIDQCLAYAEELKKRDGHGGDAEMKEVVQYKDHVLKSNKMAHEGRIAQLPFLLEEIVKICEFKEIKKGKQTILPVIRQGIKTSNDGLIWCIESAIDDSFTMKSTDEKRVIVETTKAKLSTSNLSVVAAEAYDIPRGKLANILLNSYIDSNIFIRLLEKHYNLNIIVVIVDSDNPNGEIEVPKFDLFPLQKKLSKKKKTIVIVKFETQAVEIPYNYELVRDINKNKTIFDVDDGKKRRAFIDHLIDCYNSRVDVSSLVPTFTSLGNFQQYN